MAKDQNNHSDTARYGPVVWAVWLVLVTAVIVALFQGEWSLVFVAAATLVATIMPLRLARMAHIDLPVSFVSATVLFLFATLFLGEAFLFYERYWWWDIAMHGGSAVGFGLVGFLFTFYLFEGDKYAAPAWAIAFVSFCFAIAIGTTWEIFEFLMDQVFGLNMQKSGLFDTMADLMVNMAGASVGAIAGFGFLKGREQSGLYWAIGEFVRRNRHFFRRNNRNSGD